jgi:hypothetical protein
MAAKTIRMWSVALASILAASAALSSCVVRTDWPRHEVRVTLQTRQLTSVSATSHDDEQLWVVFDAVELAACDAVNTPAPGHAFTLFSRAHAHGPTTPIRQGTPQVLDLFMQEPVPLAVFEPPPGEYCALKLSMGPADDDAFGLDASNAGVVEHSVMWTDSESSSPVAMSTARHDRTFLFAQPWRFGTDHDAHATLDIQLDLEALLSTPALHDALKDPVEIGRDVLAQLPGSLDMMDPTQDP